MGDEMVRILISGYREYSDVQIIESTILSISQTPELIIGDCRGTDTAALQVAIKNNWKYTIFPADWSLGLKAGPLRNERMIVEGKPDHAVLFLSSFSKGTLNMKHLCERYQIPITIVSI